MSQPTFDLLREPWIPCERLGVPDVVYLGIEDVLVGAHELAAVHDASPLVTATIHRLLLAILCRALAPTSLEDWSALWRAPRLNSRWLQNYLSPLRERFDLFHPDRPFLQVAGLRAVLTAESKPPIATLAARLAPELSQHSAAAYLFSALPDETAINPGEAARSLLAFLHYTPGGRVQNDATSRKSGTLRGGALVLVRGSNLKETLLLNLFVARVDTRRDLPPWERSESTPRTTSTDDNTPATRAPCGVVDALVWCSRRVELLPTRDGDGNLVVREVITAAGEDMSAYCLRCDFCGPGFKAVIKQKKVVVCSKCNAIMDTQPPDSMFAYVVRDAAPIPVKTLPSRVIWRDALALFDPATGAGAFRRPAALEGLTTLVHRAMLPHTLPLHVEILGLASDQAAILDWRAERLPLPLSLLVSKARVEILRKALAVAEDVAGALRTRVLYALAVMLLPDPHKNDINNLRENLRTIPAFWEALGREFSAWLEDLGSAPNTDEALDICIQRWREHIRRVANDVTLRAIEGVGMTGRALRAGAATERALTAVLDEFLPLPEGVLPEALQLPAHTPPVWSDATGFIPALDKLVKKKDLGALANLRMSLQDPRGMAPKAAAYVLPLLPPKASRRVCELYYRIAAEIATHREQEKGVSFGTAMRRVHERLAAGSENSSASERFEVLLAAHPDDVGELVSAALPIVFEHGALDWERLLHDLLFWSRRDRLMQREWARDFYTPSGLEVSC